MTNLIITSGTKITATTAPSSFGGKSVCKTCNERPTHPLFGQCGECFGAMLRK